MKPNLDQRTEIKLKTKLSKSNDLLWVTWQVKLGSDGMQQVVSKVFRHPFIRSRIWNLNLNLNPPSLILGCSESQSIDDNEPAAWPGWQQALDDEFQGFFEPVIMNEPDVQIEPAEEVEPLEGIEPVEENEPEPEWIDHDAIQDQNVQAIFQAFEGEMMPMAEIVAFDDDAFIRMMEERYEERRRREMLEDLANHVQDKLGNHVFVTTVCDGQIVELKHKLTDKELKIPISTCSGELKLEPGAISTFKIEIRATNILRDGMRVVEDQELFETILGSSELCDMEFKSIDGKSIKAHRLIMSNVSPVIKARFLHDGDKSNVFETHFEFGSLKSWLDHIYRRNWIGDETKIDTIMNIFMVSDYFGTEKISKYCSDLIVERLSPNNLSIVVQHDMVYLSGDQAAKDVQDAILKIVDEVDLEEIKSKMDPDNPRLASFMVKILERIVKKEDEEEFDDETFWNNFSKEFSDQYRYRIA